MSLGRWGTATVAALAFAGGAWFVPLPKLESVAAEAIAALALMAALLAPYMLMLATGLQREGLSAGELRTVAGILETLLRSSISLLITYLITMMLFVGIKVSSSSVLAALHPLIQMVCAALLCSLSCLALARTVRIAFALVGLQQMRHQLLIAAQDHAEAERRRVLGQQLTVAPPGPNARPYGAPRPMTTVPPSAQS